jgi:hypothetical protein
VFVLAPAGASGQSSGSSVPWGFNDLWGWSNNVYAGPALTNQHMQLAGAIMPDSLSANRFGVMWEYVEDHRGTYDWSMSDAQYAAMEQYTPRPVMTLLRAPVWARDPTATCAFGAYDTCMYPQAPAYDADWEAFVKAAVQRYPDVRGIEIWNEPNLALFWSPAADPVRYSTILQEAHDAVRAAGSSAPVITGGLFPVSTANGNMRAMDFLDQVYATAGVNAFEGIGSHPYPHTAPLADLYRSVQGSDVAAFIIHRLYDFDTDHYGVLNQDLTPKPAYCELGEQIGTPACPPSQTAPAGPAAPSTSIPPSAAGATGLRAAALKKCKKKHGAARARCKKKANLLPL